MSYPITNYDGSALVTILDGQIDTTATSLSLPGPNTTGYGLPLNENLVYLLQNFAGLGAPSHPIEGQLWWDKAAQVLRVYASSGNFIPVSGSFVQTTQPSAPEIGNTWLNLVTKQLYSYDGTAWNLIGPNYTHSQGVSGAIPVTVNDAILTGITHNILLIQYGNNIRSEEHV